MHVVHFALHAVPALAQELRQLRDFVARGLFHQVLEGVVVVGGECGESGEVEGDIVGGGVGRAVGIKVHGVGRSGRGG